jgi:RND family efflux transporter MFP subunit
LNSKDEIGSLFIDLPDLIFITAFFARFALARQVNVMNTVNIRHLLFIGIYALSQQVSANPPTAAYSSMPAVDCVINPYRVVDISSPVAGVIEKLYVERSQHVTAGQVVAQLEASVEQANVELAKYRASVQSEVGLGKVNINFDQLRKKRVQSLLEKQNISLENADQIEREVQLSKWKLKQAKELLGIRKLELRKAEEQLKQKSIGAPFDGFVLDTFKYRGEYVEDQAILRLAQLDPLVVEAIVPMENFGMIKPGMMAEIRPEVLFKDKLMGKVVAVDRIGDTASNTFGVKLSIPNPENRIPAGLKCIVKFLEATDEQVAEETPNQAAGETPTGVIKRPAELADQQVDVIEISSSTVAEPSVLLAAVSAANVTDTPAIDSVTADEQQQSETVQPVARVMDLDDFELPTSSAKTPTSYMVLIEQPETEQATKDIIGQLRDVGLSDFLVLRSGANKGFISLGVFSTRSSAVNRQQAIDQLGFTSSTIERYQ